MLDSSAEHQNLQQAHQHIKSELLKLDASAQHYQSMRPEPKPILDHPAAIYDPLNIPEALLTFNQQHDFGDEIGQHQKWFVGVYTGCLIVPMPNIETRHKYLKFHDLHHVLTGYSVGRIGEGKVSAWELGTGSMWQSPLLGIMNLIALSTGFFLAPQQMWHAYKRGTKSRHLYRKRDRQKIDENYWQSIADLKDDFLEIRPVQLYFGVRAVEYVVYLLLAVLIHAIVVIPALILRLIVDIGLKKSLIEMIRPPKRPDLY